VGGHGNWARGAARAVGKKERPGRRRRAAAAGGARWGRCGSSGDALGQGSEIDRECGKEEERIKDREESGARLGFSFLFNFSF
jgi:hypothetical protein